MTTREALKRQAKAAGFEFRAEKPPGAARMIYRFARHVPPVMVYDCTGSMAARIFLDGVVAGDAIRKEAERVARDNADNLQSL